MAERKRLFIQVADWNVTEIAQNAAGVANFLRSTLHGSRAVYWKEARPEIFIPLIEEPREDPLRLAGARFALHFFGPSPRLKPTYEFEGERVAAITWGQEFPRMELDLTELRHSQLDQDKTLYGLYGFAIHTAAKVLRLPTHPHDPWVILFTPPRFATISLVDGVPLRVVLESGGDLV